MPIETSAAWLPFPVWLLACRDWAPVPTYAGEPASCRMSMQGERP